MKKEKMGVRLLDGSKLSVSLERFTRSNSVRARNSTDRPFGDKTSHSQSTICTTQSTNTDAKVEKAEKKKESTYTWSSSRFSFRKSFKDAPKRSDSDPTQQESTATEPGVINFGSFESLNFGKAVESRRQSLDAPEPSTKEGKEAGKESSGGRLPTLQQITSKLSMSEADLLSVKGSNHLQRRLSARSRSGSLRRRPSGSSVLSQIEYHGESKDGQPHGFGTLKTIKGTYEGQWKEGERDGWGYLNMRNGTRYEGEFKNSQFDGKGVLVTARFAYAGEWKNGQQAGLGFLINLDSNIKYLGDFSVGRANGYGRLVVSNTYYFYGRFYDGNFAQRWWYSLHDRKCGTKAMKAAQELSKVLLEKCKYVKVLFDGLKNTSNSPDATATTGFHFSESCEEIGRRSSAPLNPGSLTSLLTELPTV